LNLIERFATQILKMSIYRIDDGKVISLEAGPDEIGKVRTICCFLSYPYGRSNAASAH